MGTINVELRSQYREVFGRSRITVHFDNPEVSVEEIMERMFAENIGSLPESKDRKPGGGRQSRAMFVSNDHILRGNSLLRDGDTLTVFPLMFGG